MSALQTIQVDVTARDIKTGIAFDPRMCPIAKAVRRATGKRYVRVEDSIEIGDPESTGGSVKIPLSQSIAEFMECFDGGDSVAPFKFSLSLYVTNPKGKLA